MDKLTATPKEISAMLQLSMPTVYALIHRQTDPLPTIQVGRKLIVPIAQLESWMQRQTGST